MTIHGSKIPSAEGTHGGGKPPSGLSIGGNPSPGISVGPSANAFIYLIIRLTVSAEVSKEMMDNTAWRKVRDAAPCSRCVYQFICPPLSNYELAIGKSDLCTVNMR